MVTSLVIVSIALGAVIGILVSDFVQRRNDRLAIAAHKDELQAAAEKLSAFHNATVEQFRSLSDTVSAHGMALKNGHKGHNPILPSR